VTAEITAELPLLREKWLLLFAGLVFQVRPASPSPVRLWNHLFRASSSSVVMRVSVFNDMLICPLTISKFPLLVTLLALLILLLYLFLSWNYVVSEYVK
jgi:predicted neutral ceramidase superfamily lipid hydrolase